MACTDLVDAGPAYLQGTLPAAEREALEAHQRDCPFCETYVDQLRATAGRRGPVDRETLSAQARAELIARFSDPDPVALPPAPVVRLVRPRPPGEPWWRRPLAWLRHNWWSALLPMASLGMFTWAAFVYAGVRARKYEWFVVGVLYGVLAGAAVMLLQAGDADRSGLAYNAGLWAYLGVWFGGAVHVAAMRPRLDARLARFSDVTLEAAERRLSAQRLARKTLRDDPAKARQLGIGRPDLPGAFDAGLVDLNGAPAATIAAVAGVDQRIADRIVALREHLGGQFSSVEDLDLVADLPPDVLVQLRDRAVFVDRDGA